jgi:hypothetical protein
MAECPICNGKTYSENKGIPFINLRRFLCCQHCSFQMAMESIESYGGLDNVKILISRGYLDSRGNVLKPIPTNEDKPLHKPRPTPSGGTRPTRGRCPTCNRPYSTRQHKPRPGSRGTGNSHGGKRKIKKKRNKGNVQGQRRKRKRRY